MLSCVPWSPSFRGFPGGTRGKEVPADAGDIRDTVQPLGQEDPLEEGMATHSVFLPGESPGQAIVHRFAQSWT